MNKEWQDKLPNPSGAKTITRWVGKKNTVKGHPAYGEGTRPEHHTAPLYSLDQISDFIKEVVIPEAFDEGKRTGFFILYHIMPGEESEKYLKDELQQFIKDKLGEESK